jgi:hypothetical protein
MYIFHITSGKKTSKDILRTVLGPARPESVPAFHGPCLGRHDPKTCQRATGRAWADVPLMPRRHDPCRHGTAKSHLPSVSNHSILGVLEVSLLSLSLGPNCLFVWSALACANRGATCVRSWVCSGSLNLPQILSVPSQWEWPNNWCQVLVRTCTLHV